MIIKMYPGNFFAYMLQCVYKLYKVLILLLTFLDVLLNAVPHREVKNMSKWWNETSRVVKSYEAYDGTPLINYITGGFVQHMDLSVPQTFNKTYDWVVSLHVGELIPRPLDLVYVENIVKAAKEGLVTSWGYKLNHDYRQEDATLDYGMTISNSFILPNKLKPSPSPLFFLIVDVGEVFNNLKSN
jgi:hypothetical protein